MRVIFLFVLFISSLYAHKLNIFLTQENDKVYVSSYYASGSFCKSCKVEVLNKNKNPIQTGITDEKGEFIVDKLDSILYVSVEAQGGHKVQNSIKTEAAKKEEISNKELIELDELKNLKEENKKLKREIKLLKEKNSSSDIFKMMFALLVIAGIFFALKRVKK